MVRDLKFRYWDTFDGESKMIYFNLGMVSGGKVYPNMETTMQYTGLKDKNGNEIYEGDILTAAFYPFQDEGKYNYHGIIEWIDEEASFYMTKRLANNEKRGMSDGISQPIERIDEFEIIGNIYEVKETDNP